VGVAVGASVAVAVADGTKVSVGGRVAVGVGRGARVLVGPWVGVGCAGTSGAWAASSAEVGSRVGVCLAEHALKSAARMTNRRRRRGIGGIFFMSSAKPLYKISQRAQKKPGRKPIENNIRTRQNLPVF